MKNIYIILVTLLFVGCNDDDSDDSNDTSGSIIGTWELIDGRDETVNGNTGEMDIEFWEGQPYFFIFTNNNTFTHTFRGDTISGTYLKNNNILTFNSSDPSSNSFEGNITTLTNDNLSFNIVSYSYELEYKDTILINETTTFLDFSRYID